MFKQFVAVLIAGSMTCHGAFASDIKMESSKKPLFLKKHSQQKTNFSGTWSGKCNGSSYHQYEEIKLTIENDDEFIVTDANSLFNVGLQTEGVPQVYIINKIMNSSLFLDPLHLSEVNKFSWNKNNSLVFEAIEVAGTQSDSRVDNLTVNKIFASFTLNNGRLVINGKITEIYGNDEAVENNIQCVFKRVA